MSLGLGGRMMKWSRTGQSQSIVWCSDASRKRVGIVPDPESIHADECCLCSDRIHCRAWKVLKVE